MTLRRKFTGAKHDTEAADYLKDSGRGAFYTRRSQIGRTGGEYRSENAGVSSEMWVRIPHTDCLRFPGEGSSALGKSGPKTRLTSVVDGQLVDIPVPAIRVME